MCHNDCQPDITGNCTDCGEEVTREPETTGTGRCCTICGEEEGTRWAGKHCTYTPRLIAGPDVKVSASAALQEDIRATRTDVTP